MSLGLSPRVLASFYDDDVIVLGMPWQRGHTLSIFSALCLSQRNQGSSGALTQFTSLPRLPFPLSSSPLSSSSVYHTLTLAFALPYHALLSLSSLPPCLPLYCSVTFLLLLFTSLVPLSSHHLTPSGSRWHVRTRCVSVFTSFWVCACVDKERSERWIKVSSSQWEINIHMAMLRLEKAVLINQP